MVEETKYSRLEKIILFALLFLFLILVFSIIVRFVSPRLFQFEYFAIFFGVVSAIILRDVDDRIKKRKNICLLILMPIILAITIRAIPYIDNSVPLGYDPGIYKYEIERYWKGLPEIIPPDLENWDRQWSPPGLFIITSILHLYGFNSFDHYNFLFIFFDVLVVFAIYAAGKRYFSQEAGIIAALFYSVSLVQFGAFYMFYFKNVMAIFLALIAIYFIKLRNYLPLVVTGAMIGATHRPTFLIFGLIYLFYFIKDILKYSDVHNKDLIKNFVTGCLILALAIAFYIPAHLQAFSVLKNIMGSVSGTVLASAGETSGKVGGGSFIPPESYQYSSFFYLILGVSGAFISLKRRDINPVLIWGIVSAIIVYSKMFFFNRFIIHLDVAILLLAGAGFYYLIKYSKTPGLLILVFLLAASSYASFEVSSDSEPWIDKEEVHHISLISGIEEDSYAMTIDAIYSPWVLGYSGKPTIAPGVFEWDKWNYSEWKRFWNSSDSNEVSEMLKIYGKPIYIYVGEKIQYLDNGKFNGSCFTSYVNRDGIKIYRFDCKNVLYKSSEERLSNLEIDSNGN